MTERLPPHLSDRELRAIYDQGYVDHYDPHAVTRMRRMLPFFELSGREIVADFGCGNGVLLELIASRVHQYVGVDFSEAFVRAAELRRDQRGIRNGTFHCDDIVAFCARYPNYFDAGFALDFSEHVYDDEFLRIGRGIYGALKPGAVLYLHTPNGEYFMERLRERGVLRQIEGHVGVRDVTRLTALLTECGFGNVRIHFLAHYLRTAAALHLLGRMPLVGRHFRARLFITCGKLRERQQGAGEHGGFDAARS
jgi:2-polyprenyl-6-hydroxyphenyl methylase/3-demethylubiquinone-9 3-methyltransferase